MNSWALTPLGEVTTQVRHVVKMEPGRQYDLLGMRMYGGGVYLRETVDSETAKATQFLRASSGLFIYNRMFAWGGSFGVVPEDLDGAFASNEFPMFECDGERLLTDYLRLYFQQRGVWKTIDAASSGTTKSRNRWKEDRFAQYAIALPPLDVQGRVVDLMSSVDEAIEALRVEYVRAAEFTRRARMALLSVGIQGAWQSDLTDSHTSLGWTELVPAGWRRETVGDVATVRSGATPRRSEQARYFDGGSIPWVKTGDLNERTIRTTPESLTEAGFAESSVRLLPADTILVAMYGGYGQIGRTARIGVAATTNQAVSALTELRDDVLPAYLHQALKAGRPKWRLVAASSRKDPNISKRDVENFDFPLPSVDEQREIVSLLEGAETTADAVESELTRLRMFRSTLLTSLLNQDVEIPESYDVLLEAAS